MLLRSGRAREIRAEEAEAGAGPGGVGQDLVLEELGGDHDRRDQQPLQNHGHSYRPQNRPAASDTRSFSTILEFRYYDRNHFNGCCLCYIISVNILCL